MLDEPCVPEQSSGIGPTPAACQTRLSPLEMEKAPCNGAFESVLFPPAR
jgi:hypothetical protein